MWIFIFEVVTTKQKTGLKLVLNTSQSNGLSCAIEDLCNYFQSEPLHKRIFSVHPCQITTTISLLRQKKMKVACDIWVLTQKLFRTLWHLLSAAAILKSSSISFDINSCTPSEGRTTSFKCLMFSFEREYIRLAPLTIVFATSNDKMEILFPLVAMLDAKPPLRFKFVILLPRVSNTSTALPSPAVPALPKSELTSETCQANIKLLSFTPPVPNWCDTLPFLVNSRKNDTFNNLTSKYRMTSFYILVKNTYFTLIEIFFFLFYGLL